MQRGPRARDSPSLGRGSTAGLSAFSGPTQQRPQAQQKRHNTHLKTLGVEGRRRANPPDTVDAC